MNRKNTATFCASYNNIPGKDPGCYIKEDSHVIGKSE